MPNVNSATESRQVRIASGIAGLDTILHGGLIHGHLYMLEGLPGAGKTILANQICFNHAAAGGRAIFVTLLAENHAKMINNLRTLSFFDEGAIQERVEYLAAYSEMREGGMPALVALLRREIHRQKASLLIVDGLVSAAVSAESGRAFKEFLHDLQKVALLHDCTILLTTSTTKSDAPEQTMVDGVIKLTDRLYGWDTSRDLQVLKVRGDDFLPGRHSYEICDDGIVVYPRLEALYAHPSRPEAETHGALAIGVEKLDAMLGGGLPASSTTMVTGPSGIGKTTLGLHFLTGSSAEEPGLMFSFYETPARLQVRTDRMKAPLRELMANGVVELIWHPPTAELLDAYGQQLLAAVDQRKVKRLFIDGLTAFKNGAIDPSRIGNFFSALANELRVRGVTTVYSLEVPNILGPAASLPVDDAAVLAENMILMRFVERRAHLHRLISILKVRESDFDPALYEFKLTPSGMEIQPTSDSAAAILADPMQSGHRADRATGADAGSKPEGDH
ncbi:MAG: recombinase RecA [Pseudomonadota bacterium]|nr:recombinase RecA [Pseudomonadota bacterium]